MMRVYSQTGTVIQKVNSTVTETQTTNGLFSSQTVTRTDTQVTLLADTEAGFRMAIAGTITSEPLLALVLEGDKITFSHAYGLAFSQLTIDFNKRQGAKS